MSTHATCTFEIRNWDEKPEPVAADEPKLTRATVSKVFRGGIEGESTVEYVMMHRPNATATFVGLEHVTGNLDGKSGSFVLEHTGSFNGEKAEGDLRVVSGSGTGDFAGITGHGDFVAALGADGAMSLDYDIE